MIKVFTKNANGKIELSEEELKNLLDEAYWDGYKANRNYWIYNTPTWSPYVWNSTTTAHSTTAMNSTATSDSAISKEYIEVTNNLENGAWGMNKMANLEVTNNMEVEK